MPHRHVAAQVLLIGAYLIILKFTVEVVVGGLFPDSLPARGLKQSISSS